MSEPAPPLDLSSMTISQTTVPAPVGGTCPPVCVTNPKVDHGMQSSVAQGPQKHPLETSSTSSNKGPEAETRTLFTSVAIYSAEDVLQSEDTETKLWEVHGKDIVVFFVGESSRSIDRLIYKLARVNPGPRTPSLPRIAFQATSRWYFLEYLFSNQYPTPFLKMADTFKVEEVIFVIGPDEVCRSPDVAFVRPNESPNHLLAPDVLEPALGECWALDDKYKDLTWQKIEEVDSEMLQSLRNEFTELRLQKIQDGVDVDELDYSRTASNTTILKR